MKIFLLKMAEIGREYNFRPGKSFFDNIKLILASLNTNSGSKHRNAMNRSLVKRRTISSFLRSKALQSFGDWNFPYKETKSTNTSPYVAI